MSTHKQAPVMAMPFLMYQRGICEAALKFYISVFPDSSRIDSITHYEANNPAGAPEGSVRLARATIAGLELIANDSFIEHGFDFTPSMSLFVTFKSGISHASGPEAGSDIAGSGKIGMREAAEKLAEDGKILMPLGDYGFEGIKEFTWIQDPYGVSWQLSLE